MKRLILALLSAAALIVPLAAASPAQANPAYISGHIVCNWGGCAVNGSGTDNTADTFWITESEPYCGNAPGCAMVATGTNNLIGIYIDDSDPTRSNDINYWCHYGQPVHVVVIGRGWGEQPPWLDCPSGSFAYGLNAHQEYPFIDLNGDGFDENYCNTFDFNCPAWLSDKEGWIAQKGFAWSKADGQQYNSPPPTTAQANSLWNWMLPWYDNRKWYQLTPWNYIKNNVHTAGDGVIGSGIIAQY